MTYLILSLDVANPSLVTKHNITGQKDFPSALAPYRFPLERCLGVVPQHFATWPAPNTTPTMPRRSSDRRRRRSHSYKLIHLFRIYTPPIQFSHTSSTYCLFRPICLYILITVAIQQKSGRSLGFILSCGFSSELILCFVDRFSS